MILTLSGIFSSLCNFERFFGSVPIEPFMIASTTTFIFDNSLNSWTNSKYLRRILFSFFQYYSVQQKGIQFSLFRMTHLVSLSIQISMSHIILLFQFSVTLLSLRLISISCRAKFKMFAICSIWTGYYICLFRFCINSVCWLSALIMWNQRVQHSCQ